MSSHEKKALFVKELVDKVKKADGFFLLRFEGITVPEFISLRRRIKGVKGEAKVVKNTLLKRALQSLSLKCEDSVFKEPTLVIFAHYDAVGVAKTIYNEVKKSDKLNVKGGFYNLNYLSPEKFKEFASLPSRDELISMLIFLVRSPVRRVVASVRGPHTNLIALIYNIKKLKEEP